MIPVKKDGIVQSIEQLGNLQNQIASSNLDTNNPSLELAEWLAGIPMIYHPWGLQADAIRFKNSLQENAKIHVMAKDVIEACHNGIVSWKKQSKCKTYLDSR